MSILVLDSRWPEMIPLAVAARLTAPCEFTDEVPGEVRNQLGDCAVGVSAEGRWLVTTNPDHPDVVARVQAGEEVLEVPSLADPVDHAVRTMRVACERGGWERAQTHESLLTYLEQETAELAEAIREDAGEEELKKELSDVLLQVLFHADIARRRGAFDFSDVAAAFVDKMKSRAPYLFDGSTGIVPEDIQDRLWQEGKRRERSLDAGNS